MTTSSQHLQDQLRQRQLAGTFTLPPLERWEKGIPFWGEIIYLSGAEALQFREATPRSSPLSMGAIPQQGIQLCVDSPDLSLKLASQINDWGYGGLVQFEDLSHEDCFLKIVVGEHLYPVIVAQPFLREFWLQLTLNACRHFLTVIDQGQCLGFWESDVVLAPR